MTVIGGWTVLFVLAPLWGWHGLAHSLLGDSVVVILAWGVIQTGLVVPTCSLFLSKLCFSHRASQGIRIMEVRVGERAAC